MGAAAAPLSLSATGLSMAGSTSAGNTAATNAARSGQSQIMASIFNAVQLQETADVGRLKATQTDTYLRNRMGSGCAHKHRRCAGVERSD